MQQILWRNLDGRLHYGAPMRNTDPATGKVNVSTNESDWRKYGWRPVHRFVVPEGEHKIGEPTYQLSEDGTYYTETYQTETTAERDARLAADLAEEQAVKQRRVMILGQLLATLGLTFPCTEDEVEAAILQIPVENRPVGLIGDISESYRKCQEVMTDEEIVQIAEALTQ